MIEEPFPELEELIEHLANSDFEPLPEPLMDIVWEHRFWESING